MKALRLPSCSSCSSLPIVPSCVGSRTLLARRARVMPNSPRPSTKPSPTSGRPTIRARPSVWRNASSRPASTSTAAYARLQGRPHLRQRKSRASSSMRFSAGGGAMFDNRIEIPDDYSARADRGSCACSCTAASTARRRSTVSGGTLEEEEASLRVGARPTSRASAGRTAFAAKTRSTSTRTALPARSGGTRSRSRTSCVWSIASSASTTSTSRAFT